MDYTMTQLPKVPKAEVTRFVADKENEAKYPVIYLTMKAWLDSENTNAPSYNVAWSKR
jgi:hypothetical protein